MGIPVTVLCAFISIIVWGTAVADPAEGWRDGAEILKSLPLEHQSVTTTPRPRPPWARIFGSRRSRQNFTTQAQRRIHNYGPIQIYRPPYEHFIDYIRRNYQNKGKWIYNIYDDQQMNETITMFEMFKYITEWRDYTFTLRWANANMNTDMYDYAMRLTLLYKPTEYFRIDPPFMTKPNFFINGETIAKALKVRSSYNTYFDREDLFYQINRTVHQTVIINTNYSGWQFLNKNHQGIKYFTEDLELNSYYYGLHLMYPYWLPNGDLDEIDHRYAEHYYFVHKQLLARYNLEMQQFVQQRISFSNGSHDNFNPQLIHQNGLPFPTRYTSENNKWDYNKIQLVDIIRSVEKAIEKGVVVLDGHHFNLSEKNHMNLLPRYLRDRFDGPNTAPIIRAALCGCSNTDNVAPSVLQHPSTTLRDPYYWYSMEYVLKLITKYQEKKLKPLNLTTYESKEYRIVNFTHARLTSGFEHYRVLVQKSLDDFDRNTIPLVYARLKRIFPYIIELNFTVESKKDSESVVRIFLGPPCSNQSCWDVHDSFFQLDAFKFNMTKGINEISWYPNPNTYSIDIQFNKEFQLKSRYFSYSTFLFPMRLIFPKGTSKGLKAKIFIIITRAQNYGHARQIGVEDYIVYVDKKPLGFPFHRRANNFNYNATNYRFYNVSIFHHKDEDDTGIFSPDLY